jgi:hypothetical protein
MVLGGWVARNKVAIGVTVLSTQTEHLYFGNNAWARGSSNGSVFKQGWNDPQCVVVEARHPRVRAMSEVELSRVWVEEGLRCYRENLPRRLPWLLWRKTAIFWGPFQDWSVGAYSRHYPLLAVVPLMPFGFLAARRRGMLYPLALLAAPVAAVFLVVLIAYAHDRFRFVVEPFMLVIASYGLVETATRLRRAPSAAGQES